MPPSPLEGDGGDAVQAGSGRATKATERSVERRSWPARMVPNSPRTRPREIASTGIMPVSEPNGRNMTFEAEESGMVLPPSKFPWAAIASPAPKSHGRKLIFF